jgi:enoyl-CoA hydratase
MQGGYWYDNSERMVRECLSQKPDIPRCTLEDWSYDTVTFSMEDDVAYIQLVDVRTGNGLTPKNTAALFDICDYLIKNPQIKVAVFTASGAYFCSGGAFTGVDLEQMKYAPRHEADKSEWQMNADGNLNLAMLMYMFNCIPQYKIAAIRGENMGAGNSLIAAMDYVIAPQEKCKLHFMEVKRGVASCMSWQGCLAKIGARQMQRLTIVGDNISAQEAKFMGLVQEIHGTNAQANERAIELGKEMAAKSHEELKAMKNSGPLARFPALKLPAAVRESCSELQNDDPDFEVLTNEVMEDCGRTGRPAALRLSQELWPHKSVKLVKCGQQLMRITLSRKNAGNKINKAMLEGLLDALLELHKSIGRVRLVEVRAQGDGAFCAGLDDDLSEDDAQVQQMLFLFSMLPMPVLGIVEGPVSGIGIALCSTFDLLAADSKKASFSFEGLKFDDDKCGVFLHNRCGEKAKDLGNVSAMNAEEARQAKLVTSVFQTKEDLSEVVASICDKVSLTGPNGVAVQKFFTNKMCYYGASMDLQKMQTLSGHISTRQVDPEFADAIAGIMDKNHKPRYCNEDLAVKPFGW